MFYYVLQKNPNEGLVYQLPEVFTSLNQIFQYIYIYIDFMDNSFSVILSNFVSIVDTCGSGTIF